MCASIPAAEECSPSGELVSGTSQLDESSEPAYVPNRPSRSLIDSVSTRGSRGPCYFKILYDLHTKKRGSMLPRSPVSLNPNDHDCAAGQRCFAG